jgi:hypothetical protein
MNENGLVFRVTVSFALAICSFWVLFLLNKSHHWLSPRHFLALAIGIGMVMCLGAVAAAVIRRRSNA